MNSKYEMFLMNELGKDLKCPCCGSNIYINGNKNDFGCTSNNCKLSDGNLNYYKKRLRILFTTNDMYILSSDILHYGDIGYMSGLDNKGIILWSGEEEDE